MHPEIGQVRAKAGLGLGDLVGVVDGDMVFAAAVDIEEIAEIFRRHGRAFDMPAGETLSPRAVPFHLALFVRRAEFPQGKVGGVAFFTHIDPNTAV